VTTERDRNAELCRQLDMLDGGDRLGEYRRGLRQAAQTARRMRAELEAERPDRPAEEIAREIVEYFHPRQYAAVEMTCGACNGPIHVGDRVALVDGIHGNVWHRSCLFATEEQRSAAWAANRKRAERKAVEADPRQAELFK
jgi:hypothetical protein